MSKTIDKLIPLGFSIFIILVWEIFVKALQIPKWILPAPSIIINSLFSNLPYMFNHTIATLAEALLGFVLAIIISFIIAFLMDSISFIRKAIYPLLIISQTIPIISVAPLFIIWFGYGILPKIIVVQLVCFFPIVISLLGGLASVDDDQINLLRSMGASNLELFKMVKLPASMPSFFSGLKISASYSIMGAIIGEWLGAERGLGVFMTLAQKSFQTEKVFAAILIITVLSLGIFLVVSIMEKIIIPWKN
ncbi:ABC-type nitrate/sulfonate/bicarbonate transport system, permease component [Desulfonispora thiosulfatigenes DSM 11270]|uniref:ABC-type nitrate/sulfonate/bicarbonate transport system, permease component n=1 Tax=Desulfonispora thiosulfatigenes DSM 11270 TaxID=656914 RepID=A0A1W1VB75_DESTI|nr:ABC transporter permease [Desulfonispora thiosulfatigenes]SMB90717.1 ABC-type nitrate/sulfonate/bicarbonate transport system, permease component [Desulfonispora thiosulfatigenes DSM 11270]